MDNTKKTLSFTESCSVGILLFGLFFGAGNLIFPIAMGANAAKNIVPAIIGFLITGVGLPLLGVVALGMSRSSGLYDLFSRVGHKYALLSTCVLYLTIGPFFAIPRCATTSFTIGVSPMLPSGNQQWYLLLFSVIFFAFVLFFALRPGNILKWVGKVLTPIFLGFLGVLVVTALFAPLHTHTLMHSTSSIGAYASQPFFTGFLEGYNTMDALASVAFGIVVVQTIRNFGVTNAQSIAVNTMRSGVISCVIMAVIYVLVTLVGARSRQIFPPAENGGIAFSYIARYHLGNVGLLILAVTVTLACLKTAVGLIVSCSETFVDLFKKGPSYRVWAVGFTLIAFVLANFGLNAIIEYSVPVLMFLYPLIIVHILLALLTNVIGEKRNIYRWTIGFTVFGALHDFLGALPAFLSRAMGLEGIVRQFSAVLPLSNLGLGWILPALVGSVIGLIIDILATKKHDLTALPTC